MVVIAILAAISIVAYNGSTARADDTARRSDFRQFSNLVELYNVEAQNYVCSSCVDETTLRTTYKATALIPTKADVYIWSEISSNPPTFDKKKIAIIQSADQGWMSVSYWSNQSKEWIITLYERDWGDGPTANTTTGSSPMPPD